MNKLKKMSDLYFRSIYSALIITVVGFLVFFSNINFVSWIVCIGFCAASFLGSFEFANFSKIRVPKLKPLLIAIISALIVFLFFLGTKFGLSFLWIILCISLFVITLAVYHINDPSEAICTISTSFFAVCYIAIPLGLLLNVLYFRGVVSNYVDGRWWFFYLVAVTKITDIGAYFVGKTLGSWKLAEKISPSKTIEGAVGGFFSAIAISFAFFVISNLPPSVGFSIGFWQSIWLGGLIGIFAQLGDLLESLFKRDAVVKDSSSIPAFGGVLDILDSLLLVSPIVYFFLSFI